MATFLKSSKIHTGTLLACRGGTICINESKGSMTDDSLFAIASISKLYAHSIAFRLIDEGDLTYETPLTDVLPASITGRLPQADKVTIRHLVDQTTGFANHEMDRQSNGAVLMNEIFEHDRRVEFDEVLELHSRLKPKTSLGGEKAYYADINALLLGKMVEATTGKTADQLLSDIICHPLGLEKTQWAKGGEEIAPMYSGQQVIECRQYLASQLYQGGIIATNFELMRFIRGFFSGELFDLTHINQTAFRPIQFRPIKYGSGMMQLTMSPLIAPFFGGAKEIRGHSGVTGSFAFYCPDKEVFVTGTVNQLKYRPFATIFRAIANSTK